MNFFTSPEDLRGWVQSQPSPDTAAVELQKFLGGNDQDLADACREIVNAEDYDLGAAERLHDILAKYNSANVVKESDDKNMKRIKREAQIMRQPGEYEMPLRVCPKLPLSVGKRLISTYNCRHYCLDSIVLDDDPKRVFCAEALWRRHVMDKFSREFKNKEGKWVGGYINERFQVFHDDGGNQMELALGERTRKPRPHQFSTERRLEEARGNTTKSIEASSKSFVKLASTNKESNANDDDIYQMFSDIVEMKEAGLNDEDIMYKVAEHYDKTILTVAKIAKLARKQANRHDGTIYAANQKMTKTANILDIVPPGSTLVAKQDVPVEAIMDAGQNGVVSNLLAKTPVVVISSDNGGTTILQIADGNDAGQKVKIRTDTVENNAIFESMDTPDGLVQDGADELGLNEESETGLTSREDASSGEFPITEMP